MKTPLLLLSVLLLGAGCASTSKSAYVEKTPADIQQITLRNQYSQADCWNHWRYAGSDAKYDYLYQYTPGSVIPYGFRYYKVPVGTLGVLAPYPFDPDYSNNQRID